MYLFFISIDIIKVVVIFITTIFIAKYGRASDCSSTNSSLEGRTTGHCRLFLVQEIEGV